MEKKRYNKIFWISRISFIVICIASFIYFFYEENPNKKLKALETATDKVFLIYSGIPPLPTFKDNNFVRQLDVEKLSANQEVIHAMEHGLGSKNTTYEITGKAAKDFVSTFKLIMPPRGTIKACACGGNPKVVLLSKGKLLTYFAIQHGKAIRWRYYPKRGDIDIEPASQKELKNFFIKYDLPVSK